MHHQPFRIEIPKKLLLDTKVVVEKKKVISSLNDSIAKLNNKKREVKDSLKKQEMNFELHNLKNYKKQQNTIYISLSAMLMMQVHSHLIKNEVIGFMAGYRMNQKNSEKKTMVITEAYPAEALQSDDLSQQEKSVEICPESASKI